MKCLYYFFVSVWDSMMKGSMKPQSSTLAPQNPNADPLGKENFDIDQWDFFDSI